MAESAAYARRGFAGGARDTTLSAGITSVATTLTGVDLSTWTTVDDNGPFRFTVSDGTNEEEMEGTAVSGNSITGITRGVGGTTAQAWDAGATISHESSVRDFDEANYWVNKLSTVLVPASASAPASVALAEDTDNGAHKVTITAPAALAADRTITLPDAAGTMVTTASGATFTAAIAVPDDAYDATTWNGSAAVPTKNAVRDKIESLSTALTSTSSFLGADVAMASANTNYDGPSVSLAAGTWFVVATAALKSPAGACDSMFRLWDGTTVAATAGGWITGGGFINTSTCAAIVTPGSTTTYKITAQADAANAAIAAANINGGGGNKATGIVAVKIA